MQKWRTPDLGDDRDPEVAHFHGSNVRSCSNRGSIRPIGEKQSAQICECLRDAHRIPGTDYMTATQFRAVRWRSGLPLSNRDTDHVAPSWLSSTFSSDSSWAG